MNKLIFLIAFFTVVIGFQSKAQTPDFTPTIEIENVTFLINAAPRDAILNVSEIISSQSVGSVVLKIPKMTAFDIVFNPTTTMSTIYGGTPVQNSLWTKTEDAFFITLTLNPGTVIPPYGIASIGLTVARKPNVMMQTNQSFTVTLVNGTGNDSNVQNNAYNVVLKAQ